VVGDLLLEPLQCGGGSSVSFPDGIRKGTRQSLPGKKKPTGSSRSRKLKGGWEGTTWQSVSWEKDPSEKRGVFMGGPNSSRG